MPSPSTPQLMSIGWLKAFSTHNMGERDFCRNRATLITIKSVTKKGEIEFDRTHSQRLARRQSAEGKVRFFCITSLDSIYMKKYFG